MSALDSIRQRTEAATEGPWKAKPYWIYDSFDSRVRVTSPTDGDDYNTAEMVLLKDAEFIAHARTDVPRLLAALDAALALADKWRYKGEFGWGAWQEGDGPDPEGTVLDAASLDLRAAVNDALEAGK